MQMRGLYVLIAFALVIFVVVLAALAVLAIVLFFGAPLFNDSSRPRDYDRSCAIARIRIL